MKKSLLLIVASVFSLSLTAQEEKDVVTGFMYANDVYYSLETGTVDTAAMNNWDIAFTTSIYSVGVIANTVSGVEVYTWPLGDTADWATLDTTGITWNMMFNSLETLEDGAFNFNQTGHPDYGWGEYGGMGLLTGDSLYVVKTVDGSYKKLVLLQKSYAPNYSGNLFTFKYANLDGSDEQSVEVNTTDYKAKNFVYYSIDEMEIVDREPVSEDWDLLFTKYTDFENYTPYYHVTGVLTNEDHIKVMEARETGLDQASYMSYTDTAFSSDITIIGYDWKTFDFATGFVLNDTLVYFIKDYSNWNADEKAYMDSAYYKIYFTGFTGMSEGKYTFMQELVQGVSTGSPGEVQMMELYPNPASQAVNLVFDHTGEAGIQIIDLSGRMLYSSIYSAGGFNNLSIDIADFNPGLYFLKVNTGNATEVLRFIKE